MKLRESIVISCVSYTAVMIIISILNGMGISDLNWIFNLELFVVTTLISLFMYIIDKLNIESVEEKTFVYLEKEVYESNLKLYELEEQLKNTSYIRVSKSIILNIEKLQSVKPLINGKLEANLKNNEKILINRHYVPEFKKKFGI